MDEEEEKVVNKIIRVVSIASNGTRMISVGHEEVVKIVDSSREYADHTHLQFDAYDEDGKLLQRFINGVFAIDYGN